MVIDYYLQLLPGIPFSHANNRLNSLEIGQARLEEKVDGLEKDIESLKDDTKEIKGSQKAQIWTLIGILGTALLGTVIRYIILPFPQS